jgi:hypothetical protein
MVYEFGREKNPKGFPAKQKKTWEVFPSRSLKEIARSIC